MLPLLPRDGILTAVIADIAQLVEQFTRNDQVAGSSPAVGSAAWGSSIRGASLVFGLACGLLWTLDSSDAAASPSRTLVVLDPGHGGLNSGATDPFHGGRPEKAYTILYARALQRSLLESGTELQVKLTRDRDQALSLEARIQIANRRGADLFVSLHLNASEPAGAIGHGTFFLTTEVWRRSERQLYRFASAQRRVLQSVTSAVPRDRESREILLDLLHQRAVGSARALAIAASSGSSSSAAGSYQNQNAMMLKVLNETTYGGHERNGPITLDILRYHGPFEAVQLLQVMVLRLFASLFELSALNSRK